VATDSEPTQAAPEAAPAVADTQPPAPPDTGANTQQSPQPIEWEPRYRALQSDYTRTKEKALAMERELTELRSNATVENDEGVPVPRKDRPPAGQREAELQARLQEAEWTIARAIYPEPVIEAYASAATLLEGAQTAADYVGAFEAYYMARSQGATPQQAAAAAAPPSAFMPRADSNRSDAPVLPDTATKLREAEQRKDMTGWFEAKIAALRGQV
jgi:hypothetical protein